MAVQAQAANIVEATGGTALTHLTAAVENTNNILGFGTGDIDPLNMLSKLALKLDEAEVPEEGRWVVVSPRFMELIAQVDSKLLSTDYNQGEGGLKNGLVMQGKLRGFSIYKTNNAPKYTVMDIVGTSIVNDGDAIVEYAGGTIDNAGIIGDVLMAGHMSAVATVSSIDKIETLRSETTFADIVRGLHVYGRSIIRPESLAVAYCTYG